jgi:hypothetical protein
VGLQDFVPIKGYENRYLVSISGEIYSIKTKKLLKQMQTEKGYLVVELWVNYKRKSVKVHRLVAETFIENPFGKKEINHKDGNKSNNHVNNLEWCSRTENMKHAYKTGLRTSRKGVPLGKRKPQAS